MNGWNGRASNENESPAPYPSGMTRRTPRVQPTVPLGYDSGNTCILSFSPKCFLLFIRIRGKKTEKRNDDENFSESDADGTGCMRRHNSDSTRVQHGAWVHPPWWSAHSGRLRPHQATVGRWQREGEGCLQRAEECSLFTGFGSHLSCGDDCARRQWRELHQRGTGCHDCLPECLALEDRRHQSQCRPCGESADGLVQHHQSHQRHVRPVSGKRALWL